MRSHRAIRTVATVGLLLASGACARFTVRADADPKVDFDAFSTFAWLPPEQAPRGDQWLQDRAIERRVQSGVEAGLRAKGYRPAEGGAPDLLMTYRLTSESRSTSGVPTAYRGYDLGWWSGARMLKTDTYERGTLIVDAIDADAKRLVWRGSASARLLPHLSFKERAKRATQAVERIMEDFPAR